MYRKPTELRVSMGIDGTLSRPGIDALWRRRSMIPPDFLEAIETNTDDRSGIRFGIIENLHGADFEANCRTGESFVKRSFDVLWGRSIAKVSLSILKPAADKEWTKPRVWECVRSSMSAAYKLTRGAFIDQGGEPRYQRLRPDLLRELLDNTTLGPPESSRATHFAQFPIL